MTEKKSKARELLQEFKSERYVFGLDCTAELGRLVAEMGTRAQIVASGIGTGWTAHILAAAEASMKAAGVQIVGDYVKGAAPNSPYEDVKRVAADIRSADADVVVAIGGGSVIDAAKGSVVLADLSDDAMDLEPFFGVGKVTERLDAGAKMRPMVAMQLASGSAAHLTKYSNMTDMSTSQKKLIIDQAVVPPRAMFDYSHTTTMNRDFTSDGGLDGVSHCMEVFFGSKGEMLDEVWPICTLGIDLIVNNIKRACEQPDDLEAREALGLGTDLGGNAIMIGGTNGAHLTSFSLVDVLAHGRACSLMNPYYTVFFAPAIEPQLREIATIFAGAGYLRSETAGLGGRDLGQAVADAMIELAKDIDFPITLGEVEGFTDGHIARALAAAKNPQLSSKLQNMPIPLTAETIDEYMGPILQAAKTGDFSLIKNMS